MKKTKRERTRQLNARLKRLRELRGDLTHAELEAAARRRSGRGRRSQAAYGPTTTGTVIYLPTHKNPRALWRWPSPDGLMNGRQINA